MKKTFRNFNGKKTANYPRFPKAMFTRCTADVHFRCTSDAGVMQHRCDIVDVMEMYIGIASIFKKSVE